MAFFEQLGKRITDAGQNVAHQTKNLADVTQLNGAISEKERKISQIFLSIGQSYYENHKSDEAAEEEEKIGEINALYSEIVENREKIKRIKGVVQCENCGVDVPLNAAFCNVCGTKVVREAATKQSELDGNICPSCHAVVSKNNLFCSSCGAKIENN